MFDEDFFRSLAGEEKGQGSEEEGEVKGPTPPPETRKEWMEREGIDTWPTDEILNHKSGQLVELDCPTSTSILGDLESIKADLMNHSPFDDRHLNQVDENLIKLEKKLSLLADRFLYDEAKEESTSENGGLCILNKPGSATQTFCNPDLMVALSQHNQRSRTATNSVGEIKGEEKEREEGEKVEIEEEKQNDTKIDFSQISTRQEDMSDDLRKGLAPSLPNKLEPLPILDAVTKQQRYSLKFWRIWKKFFCSEASCSILQCAFWWIWMQEFKPQEKEQISLYTIMAEKFSLLLLNYTSSHNKDELFKNYPKCLSQAVFGVFCHAFPKSVNYFRTDKFLHRLCNYIYEWTTGIPCPIGCWKDWSMSGLDPNYTPTVLSMKSSSNDNNREEEETSIGPGPTFECVQFITTSQCPLLRHHFLVHKIHEMPSTGPYNSGTIMSRTQIKEEAPPSMTFKELLKVSKDLSQKRNEAYEKQMVTHQQQLSEVLAQHTAARLNMKREAKKLLSQKYEVSLRAEKILARYVPSAKSSTHIAEMVDDDR